MAFPDRFEQVGILLGSLLLVGLPVSALVGALYGLSYPSWLAVAVWVLPGVIVGIPLALGKLPVTYHQVWVITLSGWVLAVLGWGALGLGIPAANKSLAAIVWILAILVGGVIAWLRPVSTITKHVRSA